MTLDDHDPKTQSVKTADDVSAETMRDIATSAPAKALDTVAAATNAAAPDAPSEGEKREGDAEEKEPADDTAAQPSPPPD